jgi:ribosomal-protein-alanine N-acetyltransferase
MHAMTAPPRPTARLRPGILERLAALPPAGAPVDRLGTPRLVLRPLEESDREEYTALLARARLSLARFFPLHRFAEPDTEVCDRHFAFARAATATGRAWRRVVCLRESGALIGAVNINDIGSAADSSGEINFWLDPEHASRGLGAEGVGAAVAHAMAPGAAGPRLSRLRAYVAPDNIACQRLLRRLCFAAAPRAHPVHLNLAGRWAVHHLYERCAA